MYPASFWRQMHHKPIVIYCLFHILPDVSRCPLNQSIPFVNTLSSYLQAKYNVWEFLQWNQSHIGIFVQEHDIEIDEASYLQMPWR